MNEHIALVKKWLADKESVSQEELQSNSDAAYDSYTAYVTAYDSYAYTACAAYAAACAARADYATDAAHYAAHYVTKYEGLTNEV